MAQRSHANAPKRIQKAQVADSPAIELVFVGTGDAHKRKSNAYDLTLRCATAVDQDAGYAKDFDANAKLSLRSETSDVKPEVSSSDHRDKPSST